ncbi:Uncharacterised protein [Mycobacteroides abscessus subsp. abscessus]|nr:Uncharacterised protein [Mycobacteroides abscessus subsp. abscessus]
MADKRQIKLDFFTFAKIGYRVPQTFKLDDRFPALIIFNQAERLLNRFAAAPELKEIQEALLIYRR